MSSKAAKLKGEVRLCVRCNLRWHDFTLQKNHLFGSDEKGYFVSAGLPDEKGKIKVYRAQPVPAENPDFYRWYPTYEAKGSELYNKIISFKHDHKGLKVEFLPLEKEKKIAPNHMRKPSLPRPYKTHRIPGGSRGGNPHLYGEHDHITR